MFWFDFLRGQRTILGMPPLAHLHGRNQYAPCGTPRLSLRCHQGSRDAAFRNTKIQTSNTKQTFKPEPLTLRLQDCEYVINFRFGVQNWEICLVSEFGIWICASFP